MLPDNAMPPSQGSSAATLVAGDDQPREQQRLGVKEPIPEIRAGWAQFALWAFTIGPFLAFVAAIWYAAAGDGISLVNIVLFVVFFTVATHGVTIGYHRYFTHGGFKAARWLRVTLAVAGSLAVEGSVIPWVADHRRHHAFSDQPGDPHSPWRFGTSLGALHKGFWWAHVGWLFDRAETSRERYVPDLLADPDIRRVDKLFPALTAATLLLPGVLGWMLTGFTWHGAWTAFLWAGLVRTFLVNHITYSINSICHLVGSRPFSTRDRSANVWPLALVSGGESWHNLHHADPTCARHGVDRGQIDTSAMIIRGFEKAGWITDVRWPDMARLDRKRTGAVQA